MAIGLGIELVGRGLLCPLCVTRWRCLLKVNLDLVEDLLLVVFLAVDLAEHAELLVFIL